MAMRGWGTLSGFALSSSYTPNQASDQVFLDKVVVPLLVIADDPGVPALTRLFCEAYAIAAQDMRRK
eukprot:2471344-Karenia_brevis.AAC.1